MVKRILVLGLVMIMGLGNLCGCGNIKLPYNAMVVGDGFVLERIPKNNNYFIDSFWAENMTYRATYINENWDPENPDSEKYLVDDTSPLFRLHIVTSPEQYDEIFTYRDERVDFEEKMYLVYLYSSSNPRRKTVTKIELYNKTLTVEFTSVSGKWGAHDASEPQRRYLVIIMDKLDITDVNFTRK